MSALAESLRSRFVAYKRSLLRAVGEQRKTPREALEKLERLYEKYTRQYLRADGSTYGDWLERGPRAELEEVREARRDDAVWDRLVDRHAKQVTEGR